MDCTDNRISVGGVDADDDDGGGGDNSDALTCCGSLIEACNEGDLEAVRRLLEEGRNVNEMTDEGESLLSLACSSGYLELAQLLLATRANVEDRGLKDTTPLMEAASAGHVDIVRLLLTHVSTTPPVSMSLLLSPRVPRFLAPSSSLPLPPSLPVYPSLASCRRRRRLHATPPSQPHSQPQPPSCPA